MSVTKNFRCLQTFGVFAFTCLHQYAFNRCTSFNDDDNDIVHSITGESFLLFHNIDSTPGGAVKMLLTRVLKVPFLEVINMFEYFLTDTLNEIRLDVLDNAAI